jgi:hypothetical protein
VNGGGQGSRGERKQGSERAEEKRGKGAEGVLEVSSILQTGEAEW